jgi:hypothetical protein
MFVYQDRRPEVIKPDGTTRSMTLREWIEANSDDFIVEPVDKSRRKVNKKAISSSLSKVNGTDSLSQTAIMAKNKK